MSTYKVIQIVGTSNESWAAAAKEGLKTASKSLRDLRVAEVTRMDIRYDDQGKILFRTRMEVSFKVETLD